MSNPFDMTDEELDALKERAAAEMEHVKAHALGDDMPCPSCSKRIPLRWDQDHLAWTAECLCGWSAAGSGPPRRKS